MVTFKVVIEKANLDLMFNRVEGMKREQTPARAAIEYLKEETKQQFVTETDPLGNRWKELKPSTLARKQGDTIGTDTGRMKRSLYSTFGKSGRGEIGFKTDYAQHFDKERTLLGMSPSRDEAIQKIFEDYLAKQLNV